MDKLNDLRDYVFEHKSLFKAAAVVIIITVAVLFFQGNGDESTIKLDDSKQNSSTELSEEKEQEDGGRITDIYVDISGEVKKPGVYTVPSDARLFEVIEKAGGLTSEADINGFNRAEVVTDGQKILIPEKFDEGQYGESSSQGQTSASGSSSSQALVNINTADSEMLQTISGIGPSTAEKIINYRSENGRFKTKEDIKNVSGIGDKTYEKMAEYITV